MQRFAVSISIACLFAPYASQPLAGPNPFSGFHRPAVRDTYRPITDTSDARSQLEEECGRGVEILLPGSGQVRFITRPKSRTMRATRQLMLPPSTVS